MWENNKNIDDSEVKSAAEQLASLGIDWDGGTGIQQLISDTFEPLSVAERLNDATVQKAIVYLRAIRQQSLTTFKAHGIARLSEESEFGDLFKLCGLERRDIVLPFWSIRETRHTPHKESLHNRVSNENNDDSVDVSDCHNVSSVMLGFIGL